MEAELFDHVHTLGGYIERKIRKGEATVWGVNWSRKQQERDVVMKNIDREMAIYIWMCLGHWSFCPAQAHETCNEKKYRWSWWK